MTEQSVLPSIQERFEALLISTNLANKLVGKRAPGEVTFAESEQGDARRRLLYVEKQAIQKKLSQAKANQTLVEATSYELHKRIEQTLQPLFLKGREITHRLLGYPDDVALLLDALSTRACSVSKLEPLVSALPWMQDELIRSANASKFKRMDKYGRPIVIETIRTALGALGIENLRLILPWYIFRHALPQITDPFPKIKDKLNEYHLGVANSALRIADSTSLPIYDAFVLGLFSGIGPCVVTRQYFRAFDKTLRDFAEEALAKRDNTTYKALQLVHPSPSVLTHLQHTYAEDITARMFEHMSFSRLPMLAAWQDNEHTLHKALVNAKAYARIKMLLRYRLIEKSDAKAALQKLAIDMPTFSVLNQSALFTLNLDHAMR